MDQPTQELHLGHSLPWLGSCRMSAGSVYLPERSGTICVRERTRPNNHKGSWPNQPRRTTGSFGLEGDSTVGAGLDAGSGEDAMAAGRTLSAGMSELTQRINRGLGRTIGIQVVRGRRSV